MNIHENACVTPAGRAHRPDRDLASPAHDGRADRDPALQGALVALEPKPTRTQAARPALRIRSAWRDDPYRHEKARPHRENRPSHHRRQNKPEKDLRHWLGGCPTRRKRRPALSPVEPARMGLRSAVSIIRRPDPRHHLQDLSVLGRRAVAISIRVVVTAMATALMAMPSPSDPCSNCFQT